MFTQSTNKVLVSVTIQSALAIALCACGGDDKDVVVVPNQSAQSIAPGQSFTLGIQRRLTQSGAYILPGNATWLTTRCTGEVAVTIESTSGTPVTNTCQSSGSSSQRNFVSGLMSVTFDLGDQAFALVTVS